jgi:hypothetical protein
MIYFLFFYLFTDSAFVSEEKMQEGSKLIDNAIKDMQSTVQHDWWMAQYPREKDRYNDECRQIYADDYSKKYVDLLELYEQITVLGKNSFYYKGPPGKEFDQFGPVVDIGTIEPYPNTPAAREEWQERPAFLDRKQINKEGGMIIKTVVCQEEVQLLHIKSGLAILMSEHLLIRKIMNEQILAEPARSVKSVKKCLKAAIYQNLIRMFWPGHSHMVFSDPRNMSKPKEKPAFHSQRLELAADYAKLVWMQARQKLLPQLEKRPDFNSATANHNHNINWKDEIIKCFIKVKAVAAQQHACDMGFGYYWYKNYFSEDNMEPKKKKKKPRKKIEFFGNCR